MKNLLYSICYTTYTALVACLALTSSACDCQSSGAHVVTPAPEGHEPESAAPGDEALPQGISAEQAGDPLDSDAPGSEPTDRQPDVQADTRPKDDEPPQDSDQAKPDAPAERTKIPRTTHVRADVPAGLRTLLDADSRMQPWVDRIMRVADRCYEKALADNPQASGTIVVALTMHKNARPDADLQSVSPALASMLPCATGELMRAGRIPLFTGPEGARHTVRLHFKP